MDKLEDILNAYIDVEKFSEGDFQSQQKKFLRAKKIGMSFLKVN